MGTLWVLVGLLLDPVIVEDKLFSLFPVLDQSPDWLAPFICAPMIGFHFAVMLGVPFGMLFILVSVACFWRKLILRLPAHLRVLSTVLVVALAVAAFIWRGQAAPRGYCGSIVRWFKGEPGVMQVANDLAEDLRTQPELAQLQPWAVDTLRRFEQGRVRTNPPPAYMSNWENVRPRLAPSEIPDFLASRWSGTNAMGEREPIVSIVASNDSHPSYLVIEWSPYFVAVGPPQFTVPDQYTNECVKAKPGVYVSVHYR